VFYGHRVVPERGDERGGGPRNANLIHGLEALDVLNQPAKFARRISLSLDHLPWITWQGGLFPPRRRPPDAAPEGPAAAGLAIISTIISTFEMA
jgi:hypothetical protein